MAEQVGASSEPLIQGNAPNRFSRFEKHSVFLASLISVGCAATWAYGVDQQLATRVDPGVSMAVAPDALRSSIEHTIAAQGPNVEYDESNTWIAPRQRLQPQATRMPVMMPGEPLATIKKESTATGQTEEASTEVEEAETEQQRSKQELESDALARDIVLLENARSVQLNASSQPHGRDDHEEGPSRESNLTIATLLLSFVTFTMMLMYLVNWPDDGIRCYAWITISITLSIFTAMLMFSSLNKALAVAVKGWSSSAILILQYVQFIFWVCLLQLVLGVCSGAIFEGEAGIEKIREKSWVINDAMRHDFEKEVDASEVMDDSLSLTKSVAFVKEVEVPVIKKKQELVRRDRNMKCWGMILGHIASFAAMRAGERMQHLHYFSSHLVTAVVPIAINSIIVSVIYYGFNFLRQKKRALQHARGLSGKRIRLCDAAAEETENEVLSLSSSFLFIQVAIFAITGNCSSPVEDGEPKDESPPTMRAACWLFGVGLLSIVLTLLFHWADLKAEDLAARKEEEVRGKEEDDHAVQKDDGLPSPSSSQHGTNGSNSDLNVAILRWYDFLEQFFTVSMTTTAMMFSWSCREAARWGLATFSTLQGTATGIKTMGGHVLLALFFSAFAFLVILSLGKVDRLTNSGAKPIGAIINSIAILVGLSWEDAYDGGVEEMARGLPEPHLMDLVISACLALLIVPAWRHHVLKKALQLMDYRADSIPGIDLSKTRLLHRKTTVDQDGRA